MAKQTFLTISKNNGIGLLTKPIDQCLTLNKTQSLGCVANIYRSDGTIFKLTDKLHVYDNSTSNTSRTGCSYNYAKSLYYLRETIPAGSNKLISVTDDVVSLDYDTADIDKISSFDRGIGTIIKIKSNQYPINIYTAKSSSTLEVT